VMSNGVMRRSSIEGRLPLLQLAGPGSAQVCVTQIGASSMFTE
jgi:hypothetical protein